jgi:hypothetical protein
MLFHRDYVLPAANPARVAGLAAGGIRDGKAQQQAKQDAENAESLNRRAKNEKQGR